MPRERDPIWKNVQPGEHSKWKCLFCGIERSGGATRIRAHLAGTLRYGITACEKVDQHVRAEALQTINAKGSVLDTSTGGTSGEGTERIVIGASQNALQSDDASNPNDMQNSNGCAPQQPSCYWPTGTGTASACPQDQVSLPPRDMPLDNLDNIQQSHPSNRRLDAAHGNENAPSLLPLSSLYISEPPTLPEPSTCLEFGTGSPPACHQDEVSLPPGDMHLDNLDNTQQSDPLNHRLDASHGNEIASPLQQPSMDWLACLSEQLAPPGPPTNLEFGGDVFPTPLLSNITTTSIPQYSNGQYLSSDEQFADGITPDAPLYSDWSYLHRFPPENPLESPDVNANTSEEIETDELHNSTVGSSVQFNSSLDVDRANHLWDCGQPLGVKVVPVCSNTSLSDTIQHPGQLSPRCDTEDGNDIRQFPSPTRMEIDPSTASQQLEVSTNTIGPSSSQELYMNEGAPITSHPNTGNNFEENRDLKRKLERLYSKEASIRDELEFAASLSLKRPRKEVANWLANVEKLRNGSTEATTEHSFPSHQQVDILMREAEDLMRQGKGLSEVTETKVRKLFEEKMVGEAFQRNTAKIFEYLVGNQISRLGIYGMGGVGKTTTMVHIHNRLLEKANYGNVLWITVSQDFNTKRLQDAIGKALGLDIVKEENVMQRVAMLHDHLTRKGKFTIILDDLWECFDLKEVGIPVRADGIKLVLTTRSLVVCNQMECQKMIKIEPLSHTEAKSLFLEELGSKVALKWETKAVVESIVKECAGLPLAVVTMARSMRGVTDLFEWKDCLEKLRESDMGQTDMEKKVLLKLQFSYNRLGNHEVQQCFLSCALYPEDKLIDKFELIEFFIDQGLIDRLNTREKQYDRGLTILNKLVNVCLLEDLGSDVKMHDLIRDMALHIMSETSIVQARKEWRKIPPEEYWTDTLEKVSLMNNEIGKFPSNISPNCPKLSTFLLNRNSFMVIPNSFFKKLLGLKVLNLSGCIIEELPDSISDLINLRALLLRRCGSLCSIPYLGKLRNLRKLDLYECTHFVAIKDLEMLVNLRYLDLRRTCIGRLPRGTLGALLNLQYLKAEAVNGEDFTNLWALETLECSFKDVDDFNKFVRLLSKQRNNLHYYELSVLKEASNIYVQVSEDARFRNYNRSVYIENWSYAIVSPRGESSGNCILIPQDVLSLTASKCSGATNLSDVSPLEKLEELNIKKWEHLRVLCGGQDEEIINIRDFPAPTPTPTPLIFPSLRVLKISYCPKLKYLFGHGPKFSLPHLQEIVISYCGEMVGTTFAVTSPQPHLPPAFPSLIEIRILMCDKMKRVVESEWLPHFPNLRGIEVIRCENMEEIIRGPPSFMPGEEISLERLEIKCCSNMRKLFPHEWMLHLRNLQTINVRGCEEMVEMISRAGQGQEGSITTPLKNTPSSSQSSISLPELKCLGLYNLPQLKSICEVPITCDSMEYLRVLDCPELNRIPLQLRFHDIEDLPYIGMDCLKKWETLIWDHPNAWALLQSHLHDHWGNYILEGRRNSRAELALGEGVQEVGAGEQPNAAFFQEIGAGGAAECCLLGDFGQHGDGGDFGEFSHGRKIKGSMFALPSDALRAHNSDP